MNDLTTENTISTKQLAKKLNTSPKIVLENAKKCLPNKVIQNGKPVRWTEKEVTVLLDALKNNSSDHTGNLYFQSKGELSSDFTLENPILTKQFAKQLKTSNPNQI